MTAFSRTIYVLLGSLALMAGVIALVVPAMVIPEAGPGSLTAHLVREQAAGFVFIGLMFFWCLRHFEQRRTVHMALLLFSVLFAAIHLNDYWQSGRDIWSPLINAMPPALLALTAPWQDERR